IRLAQLKSASTRLRTGIRHLSPGYFALVMATGIVSLAVGSSGAAGLSAAMLVLGVVCYLVLIACYMGAAAISVLAGAKLLGLPAGPLLAAMHAVVAGLSVVLWAFGTWLIPLLAGLGVWRHLIRWIPLRYGPGLWSIVFPLGMYCVASEA